MESFTDLDCWIHARQLRIDLRRLTDHFPVQEKNRLSDQVIRASRSVTNNIAEGFGRFHYLENVRFCRMARGSLTELFDHLSIAHDEGYITEKEYQAFNQRVSRVHQVLNGYINYLLRQKKESKT